MFDKFEVRRSMLIEKPFLNDMFQSNQYTSPNIIAGATIFQINLLIRLLHFVTIGAIPLSKSSLEKLKISRKASFMHKQFKLQSSVKRLLANDRKTKVSILMKLHKFMPIILERLAFLDFDAITTIHYN